MGIWQLIFSNCPFFEEKLVWTLKQCSQSYKISQLFRIITRNRLYHCSPQCNYFNIGKIIW